MKAAPQRRLATNLAIGVLAVFAVSLVPTWLCQGWMAERSARRLMDQVAQDVTGAIVERVNRRLLMQAMAARERIGSVPAPGARALAELAADLRVDEVHVADSNGVIVASSVPDLVGFDFRTGGEQAAEFLCLLDGESEYAQALRRNSYCGDLCKYAGVWNPAGGFVQVGCREDSVRNLSRSCLTGLTHNWHVGESGTITIVTPRGCIISDALSSRREGTVWSGPEPDTFWARRSIEGFDVYFQIPRASAAVERDVLVATTAVLNALALLLVAGLVGWLVSRFVRAQLHRQRADELALAADIQHAALPRVFPPFPDIMEFSIHASMRVAREVGGDFYDFYFTAPRTVTMLVADVSGKGVPAAMFMMRTKSLLKTLAQTSRPLGEVAASLNDTLAEDNDANMFVTAWIGQLDLDTGRVVYVNAGHNPPLHNARPVRERSGLAFGAMPGVKYAAHELQLAPGDELLLYTDGITEQPDGAGEMFGEARLESCVAAELADRPSAPLRQRLAAVEAAVLRHARGAEQADDCTQLAVRYRGPARTVRREYAPDRSALPAAVADLERALAGVPDAARMRLMVAADEIFANITGHSGASSWALTVSRLAHPDAVRLVFEDNGTPFDPLARRDPDTTLSAGERTLGGLGILIVKKTMSPVVYERRGGRNRLTLGLTYGPDGQTVSEEET